MTDSNFIVRMVLYFFVIFYLFVLVKVYVKDGFLAVMKVPILVCFSI